MTFGLTKCQNVITQCLTYQYVYYYPAASRLDFTFHVPFFRLITCTYRLNLNILTPRVVVLCTPVNTGQPAFDAMAQIVQKVQDMLEEKNDANGRNSVLAAYIQYCCSLPQPPPNPGM